MKGPLLGNFGGVSLKSIVCLAALVTLSILSGVVGSLVQTSFGEVSVENVQYENNYGTSVRAKLFKHASITARNPAPGVVYVHGYQNNRETSDPFGIELSRRGVVVLAIDAIGRGNSGFPEPAGAPEFDETYGTDASLEYLRRLAYVDPSRIGLMGNSLGADIVYHMALKDREVKALAFTGFAFDEKADRDTPRNMLMIFGAWDEYRQRMIGGSDLEEWRRSEMVKRVMGKANVVLGETVGRFDDGTARQILLPRNIHLGVSHTHGPVAATIDWLGRALKPDGDLWRPSEEQIWSVKEWASFIAMLAGIWAVIPFASILLSIDFFKPAVNPEPVRVMQSNRDVVRHLAINTLLMWLYPALVLVPVAIHLFVVPFDHVFPLMLANGILFWFFVINLIGLGVFLRWRRRTGRSLDEMGLSVVSDRLFLPRDVVGRTVVFGIVLFGGVFGLAAVIEEIWMVDYRFFFPFASDLTWARVGVGIRYLPFVFIGCIQTSVFVSLQLQKDNRMTRPGLVGASLAGVAATTAPLLVLLAVQYLPYMAFDILPFLGPSGGLVPLIMNLFHIVGVLIVVCPVFVGLHRVTGRPYVGAVVNTLIITWMFASSQVVAPIPT